MRRTAAASLLLLGLGLVACDKGKDADQAKVVATDKAGAKAGAKAGDKADDHAYGTPATPVRVADPASLPPAGKAPPAVAAPASLAAMWNAPINTLQGKPTSLEAYKGKALLLVNVASKCGLTPQYEQLEALAKKYGPQGLEVIGFPCNQFGKQEPGSAEEIEEFCSATYGVTFPMMEKIEVNGDGRHPIYRELTAIPDDSGHQGDIRWNFEKFVVSADGSRITRFAPKTKPDDPSVVAAIEEALPRS
jgi:glutathione peroxidase